MNRSIRSIPVAAIAAFLEVDEVRALRFVPGDSCSVEDWLRAVQYRLGDTPRPMTLVVYERQFGDPTYNIRATYHLSSTQVLDSCGDNDGYLILRDKDDFNDTRLKDGQVLVAVDHRTSGVVRAVVQSHEVDTRVQFSVRCVDDSDDEPGIPGGEDGL